MDWNEDTLNKIKTMIEKGISMESIGIEFGVTKQRIYQLAKKHKLKQYSPRKQATKLIKSEEDWVIYRLWTIARSRQYAYGPKNTFVDLKDLLPAPTHCPILGIPIDYSNKEVRERNENSPSLDRIDSSKGYIKDNVAIISWRANRIKNNGTTEDHRLIYEFMKNKLNTD